MRLLITLMLLFKSLTVIAEIEPRSTVVDSRIKVVPYQENQVVHITAANFIGTTIEFLPDEIVMSPIAIGDPSAWNITRISDQIIQISPIAVKPDTNMTIRTDKRVHYFYISGSDDDSHETATFGVKLIDPQAELLQAEQDRRNNLASSSDLPINAFTTELQNNSTIDHLYEPIEAEFWHFDYRTRGSKDIALNQVFDNGVKTFFSFEDNGEIPAIFAVRSNGEALVASVPTDNGYVVALTVAEEWVLRRGNKTLRIERR